MNSNLIQISTNGMSREDWLGYRKSGIGASEIGVILGLSPYKSSIELFYEKIGQRLADTTENIFQFMGLIHEDTIADLWQYWGGTEESMIENFRTGNIQRRCRRINAYVRNPNFPWLFVSLDRIMNKTESQGEGALEIKTLSGYESEKWESGIPPSHIVQVQTQMLVCEFNHGELCIMKDGRRFDVIPFVAMPDVQETIIRRTKEFWDKVESATVLTNQIFDAEVKFNFTLANQLKSELALLEPEPDGSDAYNDYLKRKFHLVSPGVIQGSEEQFIHAIKYNVAKEQIKSLEDEKRLHQNILLKALGEKDTIDFGDKGKVTWKKDVTGKRTFRNAIKN